MRAAQGVAEKRTVGQCKLKTGYTVFFAVTSPNVDFQNSFTVSRRRKLVLHYN